MAFTVATHSQKLLQHAQQMPPSTAPAQLTACPLPAQRGHAWAKLTQAHQAPCTALTCQTLHEGPLCRDVGRQCWI